ncbi:DHA2 family efflux MFS transporter permease subunit [Saccharibacillus sp. CPCC 101409]|uniref:DHA2 family efflux MFS transporter permease subunit n=1 Tax=Saccharibacillus sp. CPCC 101409 TaxID=3058041 RepID=UPI00267317B8|nr:DHA2 family efflux MFS transporter permease subunit [Saccharibacillus sp. CPCC 101409]MDO3408946.1 DHA2 family efflux MFS transporter permease subunit [Saccharibacillus sp. CPCC 101409]
MSTQPNMQAEFSVKTIIAPLLAIMLGMIMVLLDTTIMNVAVPSLQKYFNSPLESIQWTITGYTLALATIIPLAGWMMDKFGAKRIFLMTISLFTLGSVLCALAQSSQQLVLFRVIQGLGGGMVSPIGMAIAFKLAPPEKKGTVMGMLGIPMLLAPATGPLLSGWLIGVASWHWIFLINLPIGIAAVIVGLKFLPDLERRFVPSLDIWGIILAPIAFSMLTYGVSEGGKDWNSTSALTGIIVGGAALLVFIIVELRQKQPLLELRVFKSSDFTRGVIISWALQISTFVSILLLPLYQQNILGRTPVVSAAIALPISIGAMLLTPFGGKLSDKLGSRTPVFIGLSLISVGLFLLSGLNINTGILTLIVPLFMLGCGMGLSMMPLNTHVLNSAPPELINRVTPLTSASQQVVASFAIAAIMGYLTSKIGERMAAVGEQAEILKVSALAFGDTFFVIACIAAGGAILSLILRKPRIYASLAEDPGSSDATVLH